MDVLYKLHAPMYDPICVPSVGKIVVWIASTVLETAAKQRGMKI